MWIKLRHWPISRKFLAINLFGVVFSHVDLSSVQKNHERIHTYQQREMAFVIFYVVYVLEWLVKLVIYRNGIKAYRNLSFEREAYENETDLDYRSHRRFWAWTRFICSDVSS